MSAPKPLGEIIFAYRPKGQGGIIVCEREYVWLGDYYPPEWCVDNRNSGNRIAGAGARLLDKAFASRTPIQCRQVKTRVPNSESIVSSRTVWYMPGEYLQIGCVIFDPNGTKEFERLWRKHVEVT